MAGGLSPLHNLRMMNKTQMGNAAEELALQYLQGQGLRLVMRHFRPPHRGGGEIDLILWDQEGTLVFVEVRLRSEGTYGSGAESVRPLKQRRIVYAAQHYLLVFARQGQALPPCRFDVVSIAGALSKNPKLSWFKAAFEA